MTFKQAKRINRLKNILPWVIILAAFFWQSTLVRRVALSVPSYPDRPVGVDGFSIYQRFLELQRGEIPAEPDGNYPLFLYFLNTLRAIFDYPVETVFVPYLVQGFMLLLAGAFTYKLGRWLFSKNVGLLSCLGVVFYGRLLNYTLAYANAIPILFFFTGSLYFFVAYQRSHRMKYLWAGAIFLGLSAIGRATTLSQIGVLVLWFFLLRLPLRKVVQNVAVVLFAVAVILAIPITQNYVTYNQFVFINTNGSMNLFIGNNPVAHGQFYVPLDVVAQVVAGQSSYWAEVTEFITSQPGTWLKLMAKKLVIFFVFPWWQVGYLQEPSLIWLGVWLATGGLILVYSVRLFTAARSILYLSVAGYALPLVLFFIEERFRLPILPVLMIIVVSVVVAIERDIHRRVGLSGWSRLALVAGLVGAGLLLYAAHTRYKVGQPIGEINAPAIYGGLAIGQSFKAPCDNLYRIDTKIRTNNPEVSQQVTFHLKEGDFLDGIELYNQPLDTKNVRRATYTSFIFPEIPDSAGKRYSFYFDTAQMQTPDNGLIVLVEPDIPLDTVKSGSAIFNGQEMPADLTFFAYCRSIFDW